MKSRLISALYAVLVLFVAMSSHAAVLPLEGRLPTTPGGTDYQAYYDPNLDITWAANANINSFSTWHEQMNWASSLTIGGVSGWRLPSADVNGDGTVVECFGGGVAGCEDNEMGFLFWEEGISVASPGPFSNVGSVYWTETTAGPPFAWIFRFTVGNQVPYSTIPGSGLDSLAWAVRSGDVRAVPVPAAFWLFGSGVLGMIGLARRKTAAESSSTCSDLYRNSRGGAGTPPDA